GSDAFVLSSRQEGSPNALLEGLAAGLPAVATNVGGVRDVMSSGAEGLVVPAESPKELAAAMAQMMTMSSEERAVMAEAGHSRVASEYSMDAVVLQWGELIERAASNR